MFLGYHSVQKCNIELNLNFYYIWRETALKPFCKNIYANAQDSITHAGSPEYMPLSGQQIGLDMLNSFLGENSQSVYVNSSI